jgi:gluconate 2-dehydrogenase gamma chain
VNDNETSRRGFLLGSGGALGGALLALHWPALAAAAAHAHAAASGRIDHTFRVLSPAQARDVAAIASQIVPSGDTPGAREAGVVYFVDHVHAGIYAPYAPEFLAQLDHFRSEYGRGRPDAPAFADLDAASQAAYLATIEATPFFGRMRLLTVAGLLALPSYGGNENKIGWKLVGFLDQHAWQPPFGHYDAGYPGFEVDAPETRS